MKKSVCMFTAAVLLTTVNIAKAQSEVAKNADVAASRTNLMKQDKPTGSDTASFKAEAIPSFTFSQAQYSDSWKDGQNSLGFRAAFLGSTIYTQSRILFKNSLDAAYAKSREGEVTKYVKKEDRLNFNSSFGYRITPTSSFYWVAQLDLKTQFDKGYNADNVVISKFFTPAYIIASLGVRYQSNFGLSAVFAPVSGRFTVVSDTSFCKYVDTDMRDDPRYFRSEFGAYAQVAYEKNFNKYVGIKTTLDLFSNYEKNPENIDVDWTTSMHFNFNKWLAIVFFNRVIYRDLDRYQVKVTDATTGIETVQTRGPKVQWMESLNIGLTYKFATK